MQEEMLSTESRDFVTALASGLEVIQAFDAEHPRMTLSEVASRTGMNRAKARRFLLTLPCLGLRTQGAALLRASAPRAPARLCVFVRQ